MSHVPRIAVILFPGTNDHENSQLAAQAAGMRADIVRWNDARDLAAYDGFLLPGGWSYEDRIRAGVIAAKTEIMARIRAQGKAVLGVCNGAQILVESGMIPGLSGKVEMALAPNRNPRIGGYYCTWTHMLPVGTCAFATKGEAVIRIPVAHGEGRFVTREPGLIERLWRDNQVVFQYCTAAGEVVDAFPVNPNGSTQAIAGICNREGNVLAMMPHPERASWMRQVPEGVKSGDAGPGRTVFAHMKAFMERGARETRAEAAR